MLDTIHNDSEDSFNSYALFQLVPCSSSYPSSYDTLYPCRLSMPGWLQQDYFFSLFCQHSYLLPLCESHNPIIRKCPVSLFINSFFENIRMLTPISPVLSVHLTDGLHIILFALLTPHLYATCSP